VKSSDVSSISSGGGAAERPGGVAAGLAEGAARLGETEFAADAGRGACGLAGAGLVSGFFVEGAGFFLPNSENTTGRFQFDELEKEWTCDPVFITVARRSANL
jgi:hypothetical protein